MQEGGARLRGRRFGVRGIPACGGHDEVLRHHGLHAQDLCQAIADSLQKHGS